MKDVMQGSGVIKIGSLYWEPFGITKLFLQRADVNTVGPNFFVLLLHLVSYIGPYSVHYYLINGTMCDTVLINLKQEKQ